MFRGSIYVTTDINVVRQMMTTNKIVIIGEPDQALVQSTNALVASVLMPPYHCMMARMDGDMQSFVMAYNNHLSSIECSNFIAALLRAIYNGTNILLYSTQDEFSLYFEQLYNYLVMNYGVFIGTPNQQFSFNPEFTWRVCTSLYMYELFTVEEFFINYPAGIQIPDDIIAKLVYEINPYVNDQSLEGYKKYFYDFKERIKGANRFLAPVMMMKVN